MLLFFCCSAPSLNRYHIFWNVYLSLLSWATLLQCDISGFFFFFSLFFQHVQPDSWSSLCDTGGQARLHWLQPSGYLTQPLATQWLTQRLIGVMKASYLTHQNNKYCYQAGSSRTSFLCRPRRSLVSSLPLAGSSQKPYACIRRACL